MPNMLSSGQLIASIQADLADNNAGLISAEDVRHNMEDIAFSINKIVASGDTDVEFPFYNNVRLSKIDGDGDLSLESGVFFPFCDDVAKRTQRQTEPWLGDTGVDHGSIDGLADDDHLQYYARNGARPLTGNMSTDSHWINKSGISNVGFRFEQTNAAATEQEIYVSGTMRWKNTDNSILENAKGVSKAWCFFNASGVGGHLPVVHSWHNIHSISKKAQGQFKITFTSGTFENNHFVAVGTSNGTNASGTLNDMETNAVACIARSGDDGNMLRSVTYVIRDEGGSYTDSAVCQFVAYGYSPNETSGTPPTMVDEFASPTF